MKKLLAILFSLLALSAHAQTATYSTLNSYYTPGHTSSQQGMAFNGNLNIQGDSLVINSTNPSALAYLTFSGSVATGDVIQVTFHFSSHSYTASYTTQAGDNLNSIALGIGNSIIANANLYVAAGVTNPAGGGPPAQILNVASTTNPLILDYDITHPMTVTFASTGSELLNAVVSSTLDSSPFLLCGSSPGVAITPGSDLCAFTVQASDSAHPTQFGSQYGQWGLLIDNSTVGSLHAHWAFLTVDATTGGLLSTGGLSVGLGIYAPGVTGGEPGKMNANFNDYQENGVPIESLYANKGVSTAWTPTNTSLDSFSLTNNGSYYVVQGKVCTVYFDVTFPNTTGKTNYAKMGGLPCTSASTYAQYGFVTGTSVVDRMQLLNNSTQFIPALGGGSGNVSNQSLSNIELRGSATFITQ